jgi:hypothetical protein
MNQKKSKLEWHPLPGYEGSYLINTLGTVRSISRFVAIGKKKRFYKGRYIQSTINNRGYRTVRLSKDGICKTYFLHTLLAKTFIPNYFALSEVNHKNGNKLDNSLSNLEWLTHRDNIIHAYETGLIRKKGKPVVDACSGKEFSNTKEAALFYDIKPNTLRNYLNGNIKLNPTCLEYKPAA